MRSSVAKRIALFPISLFGVFGASCGHAATDPRAEAVAVTASADLVLLETADIHATLLDYDYYKDAPTDGGGLASVATLVEAARAAHPEAILVDNGDLLQ